ncbi:hypothetical protein Efla_002191 [Eimeria flavescens]
MVSSRRVSLRAVVAAAIFCCSYLLSPSATEPLEPPQKLETEGEDAAAAAVAAVGEAPPEAEQQGEEGGPDSTRSEPATTSTTDSASVGETGSSVTSQEEEDLLLPPRTLRVTELLQLHLQQQRRAEDFPLEFAAEMVAMLRGTADALSDGKPPPPAIGDALELQDPRATLAALQASQFLHLSPPVVERLILEVKKGKSSPEQYPRWWNISAAFGKKKEKSLLLQTAKRMINTLRGRSTKTVTQRLWNVCNQPPSAEREEETLHHLLLPSLPPLSPAASTRTDTVLEHLLLIDKKAHMLLELAMVGFFGVCKPHFALEAGSAFNCGENTDNDELIQAGVFVPLPDPQEQTLKDYPPLCARCFFCCFPRLFFSVSATARAATLRAVESSFAKSLYPLQDGLFGLIPVSSPYSTPLLNLTLPPWHLLVGGTYYENAAVDVLERLTVFEQVVNALPVDSNQMFLDILDMARRLCSLEEGKSRWILGEVSDAHTPANAAVLGGFVTRMVTVLTSITGSPDDQNKDWLQVLALLKAVNEGKKPSRTVGLVNRYMQEYAKHIQETVFSGVLPVSLRAVAMILLGVWASHEDTFSFSNPETKAKALLVFALLVNPKGPIVEAVNMLRSFSRYSNKAPSVNIGSVVKVAAAGEGGPETVIFSNPKGLRSPIVELSQKGVTRVLMHIAAKSPDVLAPIKAAASLLTEVASKERQSPAISVNPVQQLELQCAWIVSRDGRQDETCKER